MTNSKHPQFFVISDAKKWRWNEFPISLIIGNFDGVHLGHQELLKSSIKWASLHKGLAVVFTFDPHPQEILLPDKPLNKLFDREDVYERFRLFGMNGVFEQQFTLEFSQVESEIFLNDYLFRVFDPRHLVVGSNFFFGKNRQGTPEVLRQICAVKGIDCDIIEPLKIDGEKVSSSAIRSFLKLGDPLKAKRFLGRPFFLKGKVVEGEKRGAKIGFPTANLLPIAKPELKKGVYVTETWLGEKSFPSVTNIGVNPTFNSTSGGPLKIETHLLRQNLNLYDNVIRVEFHQYIREEQKFSGLEELKAQINKDIQLAEKWHNDQNL